ncbi:helix-turn-helix transcriptional regulator [Paenibacillus sp. sptzw28]|nr:helix-turn-helix transcriptional regulator [Paenibacillus sp. sptzw28]
MAHSDSDRLKELGRFLQTRRHRLRPEQFGFATGSRRRTPGLRRGEVASLAGVSVDWYTWLEQGRSIQVSAQVLESLARALQLDSNERRHLFLLGLRQPPPYPESPDIRISPTLRQFLDGLGNSPAIVSDPRWNAVGWNRAACAVFGDYETMSALERNLVWCAFTSISLRELLADRWEGHARRRLAQFRASYGRFAGDPWWADMIEALSRVSAEFNEWWPQHDVLNSPEGENVIQHPEAGTLIFNHLSFQLNDNPDLQITIKMPSETYDTASKLTQLLDNYSKRRGLD